MNVQNNARLYCKVEVIYKDSTGQLTIKKIGDIPWNINFPLDEFMTQYRHIQRINSFIQDHDIHVDSINHVLVSIRDMSAKITPQQLKLLLPKYSCLVKAKTKDAAGEFKIIKIMRVDWNTSQTLMEFANDPKLKASIKVKLPQVIPPGITILEIFIVTNNRQHQEQINID